MPRSEIYKKELAKLNEIFSDVEDSKRKLVDGLIEDAAFLKTENNILKKSITETGMVKINPDNSTQQKPIETAKQYLKNINSYAVVIKTLNGILSKNVEDDDDEMSEFE